VRRISDQMPRAVGVFRKAGFPVEPYPVDWRERMDKAIAVVGGARVVRGGGSALKGRKVPPKYRGPSGETWAGRGARPRWGGKKLDDFLIDKSARKRRKKRRSSGDLTHASFVIETLALQIP